MSPLRISLPLTPLWILAVCLCVLLAHIFGIMWIVLVSDPPLKPVSSHAGAWMAEPFSWPAEVPEHWPQSCLQTQREAGGWGIERHCAKKATKPAKPWQSPSITFFVVDRHTFGWPYECMTATVGYTVTAGAPAVIVGDAGANYVVLQGWTRAGLDHDAFVPLRVTSGAIGNTVVYLLAILAPVVATRLACAHGRIRRGLCPKCAYDLRGSTDTPKCPECGAQK